MRNNLQIRDARLDELDGVANLIRDAYVEYKDSFSPSAWESYLEDIMDVRGRLPVSELIVAQDNGQLVGAVTLYVKAQRFSLEGWPVDWASIRLLAVRPRCRGRGVGRSLMEECVLRCHEQGVATIGLHTSELMDVARRMYERIGFRRVPEFDFRPAPGVVLMAYRLDL